MGPVGPFCVRPWVVLLGWVFEGESVYRVFGVVLAFAVLACLFVFSTFGSLTFFVLGFHRLAAAGLFLLEY